jgi:phage gpG-like protein
MTFRIVDFGDATKVARKLKTSGKLAENTKPIMEEIADDMLRIEAIVFSSGGRRGGGSWARLKPDTVRKKGDTEILRTENANPGYSDIGGNALFKSLTERDAPFQILDVTAVSVELGTDRPWAFVHEYGSAKKKIPARPFIRFLPTDIAKWSRWIGSYVTEPFRK